MAPSASFTFFSSESFDPAGPKDGVGSAQWPGVFPAPWSMKLHRLEGGRRDGVHLLHVDNGKLRFDVLPTRGMGLWRGQLGAATFGWNAPLRGPVHPAFVDLADRGGLGWLDGFDEWLCRCGLSSLGPPTSDPKTGEQLTLHGRIANQPAHRLEVAIQLEPPFALKVTGHVQETTLFFSGWELRSSYTTFPGSNRLIVEDEIVNARSTPAELYLLYHLNFGPPLLGAGSRLRLPLEAIEPRDEASRPGLKRWDTYEAPTPGFAEQVYYAKLKPDAAGMTWALLHDQTNRYGCRLGWRLSELPCFTQWKNSMPESDGYVTGIEPATCYPNIRPKEREAGRAVLVPPGGSYRCGFTMDLFADGVPNDDWLS